MQYLKNLIYIFSLIPIYAYSQNILPEQVVFIPKKLIIGAIELETTIFKPKGNGPFPLVIINHGKEMGNTHLQSRYRPISAVRYFLERNYVVFVPMRQGFSKSGGSYSDGSCSMKANAELQAENIKPVIDYAHSLEFVDHSKTLIVGQSHGGLTTLAYGATNPDPSVKGLVNFAGGLKNEGCSGWRGDLIDTVGDFGRQTKIPSVWFYGDNDSYFSREISSAMFEKYKVGNSKSYFIAYGKFQENSHYLFKEPEGRKIWEPYLTKFLDQINLPTQMVNSIYTAISQMSAPPKSDFADIRDVEKIPYLNNAGKAAYKTYLTKSNPKAFSISESAHYGWKQSGEDPLKESIENCMKKSNTPCKLYAVDDDVVWEK